MQLRVIALKKEALCDKDKIREHHAVESERSLECPVLNRKEIPVCEEDCTVLRLNLLDHMHISELKDIGKCSFVPP